MLRYRASDAPRTASQTQVESELPVPVSRRRKIHVVIGTRPECIKTVALIDALRSRPGVDTTIVATGQHPAMVAATLADFGVVVDQSLPSPDRSFSLSHALSHFRDSVRRSLSVDRPDLVVVQGDTTSAYAGALAARDLGIGLAHVEAGLRTNHPCRPFPEEHFRRRIALLADWHYAPTAVAEAALHAEGISAERVRRVGNTGIDALRRALADPREHPAARSLRDDGLRQITLTLHRRENYGRRLDTLCLSVVAMLERHTDLAVLCPVHPNPAVGQRVRRLLGGHPRVMLTKPMPYREFITTLAGSRLVITDSGGIQEEAPYLGLPVIVVRENTERPEATASGHARLVGVETTAIRQAIDAALAKSPPAAVAFDAAAPFGDGRAAERIADHLCELPLR